MSDRRLIAMIGGWATAGDPSDPAPSAVPPPASAWSSRRSARLLGGWIAGVAGIGVVAVLAAGLGAGAGPSTITSASPAGAGGMGFASDTVAGLAAAPPVAVSVGRRVTPEVPTLPVATRATIRLAPPPPAPSTAGAVAPTVGTVEAIILEVFGPHGRAAIGVARCESRLNPASVSLNGANWGLFQINVAHRSRVAQMGYRWEQLLDPHVNAVVARSIFDEQGWGPWACRGAGR